MQYGFAIDQRTCIGCHACTVACKTEHNVPVGQFRTWVKYVDKGVYPSTTREMGVLRCNHCTDAPCVKICPTTALFKREDGIVDFDSTQCIGCKSCMQACPYDAIYIDAETNTAAKCNFCAHRIDQGLEPACVVVCPTESIWVGDVEDPSSGISKFLSIEPINVRTPEQGTRPNVYYVGADQTVLDPLAAPVDGTYIWADADPLRLETAGDLPGDPATKARTTLNTAHPRPWGWKVWTYLWTKSLAAGALVVAALMTLLLGSTGTLTTTVAPLLTELFLLITAVFLVWDLKQPKRFLFLLDPRKINRKSWLAIGGIFLGLGAAVGGLWFIAGLAGVFGANLGTLITVLAWIAIPTGMMVAGYTAFLFGQAEGRDLWQSPVLFWHLQAQMVMSGAGALLIAATIWNPGASAIKWMGWAMLIGVIAHLLITAVEFGGKHSTRNAEVAAHTITHGRYAREFWLNSVLVTVVAGALALTTALTGSLIAGAIGGLLVQIGLLVHEKVFVKAAQDVPLS